MYVFDKTVLANICDLYRFSYSTRPKIWIDLEDLILGDREGLMADKIANLRDFGRNDKDVRIIYTFYHNFNLHILSCVPPFSAFSCSKKHLGIGLSRSYPLRWH